MINKYKNYKKELKSIVKYITDSRKYEIKQIKNNQVIRACPICNISNSTFVFTTPAHDFVRCDNCGLVYAKNILSKKELQKYYENQSFEKSEEECYNSLLNEKKKLTKIKRPVVAKILKFSNGRDKCLDIGCSFGEILFHLKPYFRSVEGLELNKVSSEIGGKLFDIKIYNKSLAKLKLKKESYDCIILNQVIEHLDDFDLFYKIHQLLKPKGIIYIGCPNMDSLSMKFFNSKHIHIYSILHINMFNFKSFEKFAEKYNFRIKSIETNNNLDIQLNDIISVIFKRKKFIHRYNNIPFINPMNVVCNSLLNKFFNKTKILSKHKLGSYLEVVLEK